MQTPFMHAVAMAVGVAALTVAHESVATVAPHAAPSSNIATATATATAARSIPFVQLHNASNSGFTRNSEFVIQDVDEYARRWKGVLQGSPDAERPDVDFQKNTVVLVAIGIRNTDGHSVRVDSVTAEPVGGATVHYTITSPGSRCMSLQLLTSPIEVISFERVTGVVKFKKHGVSGKC